MFFVVPDPMNQLESQSTMIDAFSTYQVLSGSSHPYIRPKVGTTLRNAADKTLPMKNRDWMLGMSLRLRTTTRKRLIAMHVVRKTEAKTEN